MTTETETGTRARVSLDAVHAGHDGADVLCGVSAQIRAGTVTALVGDNGSGKSTLLGVLAGTHPLRSGRVEHRGSHRPAFVPQRSAVPDALPLTVVQTVRMGRWARRGAWRRLRREDHGAVAHCLDRLGVADLAGRPLHALSGGQRQRVLVAQGLAQEADLLLLDEPSTGLDTEARAAIAQVLAEERDRGCAVVVATHSADEARGADRVLRLHDGHLTETPAA
ncbi:metal ABC transporter ATP-binding protein [Nocardiopsis sp. HNM0947]|uniref:Metal ABC transporter ATP-binding protein n=1 Tax=Nocardiopsis coralli TaxID=2772213 RepID=A0ABR9P9R5_9ACTN|nr:zinc ABC transporter ATP-binding protein AztA [Nocardiopsis coralli]MBE3000584.1 metal ABC transporter ATP-binding protein [Nocardiopsis coralli]